VSLTQSPAQAPAPLQFEVASVKPLGHPPASGGGPWTLNHGRFKADQAWIRGVIALAYSLLPVQVHGGPSWIDSERYDFVAKAESPDASQDQLRAMLQSLLTDRFKLVVHRETQEVPVYTLAVGKSGSKMQESKDGRKNYINWTGPGQVVFTESGMLGLISILSSTVGGPVVDKTGLTGFYSYKLEFTDPRFQRPGSQPSVDAAPDIFRAVQEQLGLKLEAKKGPVEVLVVDHAERASEN
jgi:uncharacterized protein (TIGR03435 family)